MTKLAKRVEKSREGVDRTKLYPIEDAVQMIAAVRGGAAYLVTRNAPDYRAGPLPALQPAELLALL